MAKFPSLRRRWRGVPLGGPLQHGCKFCLTANDGEAKTHEIAAWLRPEMAYRGRGAAPAHGSGRGPSPGRHPKVGTRFVSRFAPKERERNETLSP